LFASAIFFVHVTVDSVLKLDVIIVKTRCIQTVCPQRSGLQLETFRVFCKDNSFIIKSLIQGGSNMTGTDCV
jgi:hypothetical protein